MALNFSHRPVFPVHLPDDSMVSPIRISNGYMVDGVQERKGEGYSRPWHSTRDAGDCFGYGKDNHSEDSASNDILDLLPSDPFGMDISTTFTAITGWLEDLEADYSGYGGNEACTSNGDYNVFAGLNFIWNNALKLQSLPRDIGIDEQNYGGSGVQTLGKESQQPGWCLQTFPEADANSYFVSGHAGSSPAKGEVGSFYHDNFGPVCNVEGVTGFSNAICSRFGHHTEDIIETARDFVGTVGDSIEGHGGDPHAALLYALGYLGVRDLLAVEMACKSLRSAVKDDPLLWRSIHLDQSLKDKITDDFLLQLTNRAQGSIQCLSLVDCPKITDGGLRRILERNTKLSKLCVPGCTRLSVEGVISSLKAFKLTAKEGIKHLRIGGLYGISQEHIEELKCLLGKDILWQPRTHKPHFYRRGNCYISCEDDRAIDIETCPRCHNFRLVYDCPYEGCQAKDNADEACRACTLCIPRCVECGRCVNDSEYEETFCLELLCVGCFNERLRCQEKGERKFGPSGFSVRREESCTAPRCGG